MTYIRNCPKCNVELKTENKYFYKKCVKNNSTCLSCSLKGKPKSETAKMNMSKNHADFNGDRNPFYNKSHTDETKRILRNANIGQDRHTDENKSRMSMEYSGEGNPFFGKKHSERTKEILSNRVVSDETRCKISMSNIGKNVSQTARDKISNSTKGVKKSKEHGIKVSIARKGDPRTKTRLGKKNSDDHNRKIRVGHIKRRKEIFGENMGFYPNVNKKETEYFRLLESRMGWNGIYHGKDGNKTQFHVKDIGYFVDFYDEINNIVVEYDETSHYDKNWNLRPKDIKRQNEIKNHLKCKFYRYIEPLNRFYEV